MPGLLRLSLADRQMLNRADFDEKAYRAKLTQALSTAAKPTPRSPAEATKPQGIVTTVPSIGLQVLGAGDAQTTFWGESLIDDLGDLLGQRSFRITTTHDTTKDLAALGRALDVSYVVSGGVRQVDDRFRVNLKLTKGGSGVQVWGARYDEQGDPIDASRTPSRRAASVDISAAIIEDERKPGFLAGADSERLDAWELCIQASSMPMTTARQCDAVIALFRQAVERDPHFAFAHAMLAVFLWLKVVTMFSRAPDADIAESLAHADRALSIAPANPFIMSGAAIPHRGVRQRGARARPCAARQGRRRRRRAVRRAFRRKRPLGVSRAGSKPGGGGHRTHAGPPDWYRSATLSHRVRRPRTLGGSADVLRSTAPRHTRTRFWRGRSSRTHWLRSTGWGEARDVMQRVKAIVPTFTLAYYEKGTRLSWRNREKIVDAQLAGLRRLEMA